MTTAFPVCTNDKRHGEVEDEERSSLMYMMLPHLVRRSVPKVRSIRRSLSGYSTSFGHTRASSIDGQNVGNITPPPAYSEPLAPLTAAFSDAADVSVSESDDSKIRWKYASQGMFSSLWLKASA